MRSECRSGSGRRLGWSASESGLGAPLKECPAGGGRCAQRWWTYLFHAVVHLRSVGGTSPRAQASGWHRLSQAGTYGYTKPLLAELNLRAT